MKESQVPNSEMTIDQPLAQEWELYIEAQANRTAEFEHKLDTQANPPSAEFLKQYESEPLLVAGAQNIRYGIRFISGLGEQASPEAETLPPVAFFTQWSVAMDSRRGQHDVYGVAQGIESNRSIIAIDLPGHGQADPVKLNWLCKNNYKALGADIAEALQAAMRQTGRDSESFHVAGISSGGLLALTTASALREKAKSVTLVSTPGVQDIGLYRLAKGFAGIERANMQAAINLLDAPQRKIFNGLESSSLNAQARRPGTQALLGKLGLWMADDVVGKNLPKLSAETKVSFFGGTNDAIVDWKKLLELTRGSAGNSDIDAYFVGNSQTRKSHYGTHARLSVNRYEAGVWIAETIKRRDAH